MRHVRVQESPIGAQHARFRARGCTGDTMRILQIATALTALLFVDAANALASAPVSQGPHSVKPHATTSTQDARRPLMGGRAIPNPKLMGKLDLSNLPKGPDGQRIV